MTFNPFFGIFVKQDKVALAKVAKALAKGFDFDDVAIELAAAKVPQVEGMFITLANAHDLYEEGMLGGELLFAQNCAKALKRDVVAVWGFTGSSDHVGAARIAAKGSFSTDDPDDDPMNRFLDAIAEGESVPLDAETRDAIALHFLDGQPLGEMIDRYPAIDDDELVAFALALFVPGTSDVKRAADIVTADTRNRWQVTRVDVPAGIYVSPYAAHYESERIQKLAARLAHAFGSDVLLVARFLDDDRTRVDSISSSGKSTRVGEKRADFHRALGLDANARFVDDNLELITPDREPTLHVGHGMEADKPARVSLSLRGPGYELLHSSSFRRARALRVPSAKLRALVATLPSEQGAPFAMSFEGDELQHFRAIAKDAGVSVDDAISALLMVAAYERQRQRQ